MFRKEIQYIYCVPQGRTLIDEKELKNTITNKTDHHKALFSFELIYQKKNAKLLAQSWNFYDKTPNNFWIIAVKMSSEKYLVHRKNFYGDCIDMGAFLHPLLDRIVYCENGEGEKFSLKDTNHFSCIIC